jgi:hypothetical protein
MEAAKDDADDMTLFGHHTGVSAQLMRAPHLPFVLPRFKV